MSAFDGVENAQVFENSAKMNPGYVYDLEIVRMVERQSGRDRGTIVPIEFVVLSTNDPNTAVGSAVSWVPKSSHGHAFLSNLKAFVLAALGMEASKENIDGLNQRDPKDPKGRSYIKYYLEEGVGQNNILAGYKVRCQTTGSKTKAGNDFTSHRFCPMP